MGVSLRVETDVYNGQEIAQEKWKAEKEEKIGDRKIGLYIV